MGLAVVFDINFLVFGLGDFLIFKGNLSNKAGFGTLRPGLVKNKISQRVKNKLVLVSFDRLDNMRVVTNY